MFGGFKDEVPLWITDGWVSEDVKHSGLVDLAVQVAYDLQNLIQAERYQIYALLKVVHDQSQIAKLLSEFVQLLVHPSTDMVRRQECMQSA